MDTYCLREYSELANLLPAHRITTVRPSAYSTGYIVLPESGPEEFPLDIPPPPGRAGVWGLRFSG